MTKMTKRTFREAFALYLSKATTFKGEFLPVEEYSSERMGGWIMKDANNMYVGWVGNRDDVTYAEYCETLPEHNGKLNRHGVRYES